jgi:hypothetical protein
MLQTSRQGIIVNPSPVEDRVSPAARAAVAGMNRLLIYGATDGAG